jgi:hypothetical protein
MVGKYAFADIYGPGFGSEITTSEQAIPEATEREHYGEAEGFSPATTAKQPQIFAAIVIMLLVMIFLNF